MLLKYIVCIIAGYLFGSISCGLIAGKLHHIDLRKEGSGNLGTTNVLRTLGKLPALFTFIGDLAKIVIPIVIIRLFIADADTWYLLSMIFGLGGVLGHNYPFYLNFKGGKGIAVTSAVVVAAAQPIMIPIGIVAFIIVVVITRYVSVGSLVVVAWYLMINTLIFHQGDKFFIPALIVSLFYAVFAFFQHRENIKRLIKGTENKLF